VRLRRHESLPTLPLTSSLPRRKDRVVAVQAADEVVVVTALEQVIARTPSITSAPPTP